MLIFLYKKTKGNERHKKMRKEVQFLSSIILNVFHQDNNMIILNYKKIKTSFNKLLNKYKESLNFGVLVCPCCGSSDYIKWSTYSRNVIYKENDKVISEVLKIQRIRCKSCGKTHALLPDLIVPYKQLNMELIIDILLNYVVDIDYMEQDYFNIIVKQFNKNYKIYLRTTFPNDSISDALIRLKNNLDDRLSFIKEHKRCFMQMKLLFLGYASF